MRLNQFCNGTNSKLGLFLLAYLYLQVDVAHLNGLERLEKHQHLTVELLCFQTTYQDLDFEGVVGNVVHQRLNLPDERVDHFVLKTRVPKVLLDLFLLLLFCRGFARGLVT